MKYSRSRSSRCLSDSLSDFFCWLVNEYVCLFSLFTSLQSVGHSSCANLLLSVWICYICQCIFFQSICLCNNPNSGLFLSFCVCHLQLTSVHFFHSSMCVSLVVSFFFFFFFVSLSLRLSLSHSLSDFLPLTFLRIHVTCLVFLFVLCSFV